MADPQSSLVPLPDETLLRRAGRIQLLVLDVDGVLTDGTLWYGETGEAVKAFNSLDGLGMTLLKREQIAVAFLSARDSAPLRQRAGELGVTHLLLGRHDKAEAWQGLLRKLDITAEQAAYAGDDLIDLPVLRRAGLAITVPNGHPALRQYCHWCTERRGGQGAVREICELLLAGRGRLDAVVRSYADA
ncbi:HAD hydrolase family protein [Methylonatrum kenyense]|uniref:KdsC family phosphatase n=1 Tax=Methylonatrum kenyense TaxID=455253 RepID=UPI0020BE7EDC|nr:HAD hydrolase family protein [Methylonatrum kenyense]MCK8516261.1 HAD hydrolase family protein [Methylonatrum kenyense]